MNFSVFPLAVANLGERVTVLFRDVDLKTTQTITAALPPKFRFIPLGVTVVGRSIASLSGAPTMTLHQWEPRREVAGTAASLETNLTGTNNDLAFTAVSPGTAGNSITVTYVNPGTPSAALSVAADGSDITVNLATSAGTAQVETATVGGDSVGGGDVVVTVTGAGITGSPLATNVTVAALDDAATVAGKIRTALGLVAAITSLYTVGGSGADITLTRTVAAANDATLNIAIDGTANSTGVPDAATSADTTAGVAPAITTTAAQIKAALEAYGAAVNLITVAHKTGNDGTGVVTAMAEDALEGGVDASIGLEGADLLDSTDVAALDGITTDAGLAVGFDSGSIPFFSEDASLRLKITSGATATTARADIVVEGVMN